MLTICVLQPDCTIAALRLNLFTVSGTHQPAHISVPLPYAKVFDWEKKKGELPDVRI